MDNCYLILGYIVSSQLVCASAVSNGLNFMKLFASKDISVVLLLLLNWSNSILTDHSTHSQSMLCLQATC